MRWGVGWDGADYAIVIIGAIATFFVHPVHLMLSRPYWFDESWVAALTRAPFARLPALRSSAPIGFVALLKLVPGSGLQRGRLLVVAFSAATVVVSYVLVRSLSWKSAAIARYAAAVVGLAVMLTPLSLLRNDLKQYTCDGFCAVLLLILAAWVDRDPDRKPLVWLAVAAVLTPPFSSTALFVVVAVFVGVFVSAMLDGAKWRAFDILVAGGVVGIALGVYFSAVMAPTLNSKLRAYWAQYYLHGSPITMVRDTWDRLVALAPDLAMPAAVFLALLVCGIVVLVRLRARAIAIALPLLWVEMAIVGRFERYPFLDLRTSHFLLVSSLVVVVLGALGVVGEVRRRLRATGTVVGADGVIVVIAIFVILFMVGFVPYLDRLHLPVEDVRAETIAVAHRRNPTDVILVNMSANFGFSYYWPHGHVRLDRNDSGQGFGAHVVGLGAIYVPSSRSDDVLASLREAVNRLRRARPGSRLYIVRSHVAPIEEASWQHALAVLHLKPRVVRTGGDPLLVVGPLAPAPRRAARVAAPHA